MNIAVFTSLENTTETLRSSLDLCRLATLGGNDVDLFGPSTLAELVPPESQVKFIGVDSASDLSIETYSHSLLESARSTKTAYDVVHCMHHSTVLAADRFAGDRSRSAVVFTPDAPPRDAAQEQSTSEAFQIADITVTLEDADPSLTSGVITKIPPETLPLPMAFPSISLSVAAERRGAVTIVGHASDLRNHTLTVEDLLLGAHTFAMTLGAPRVQITCRGADLPSLSEAVSAKESLTSPHLPIVDPNEATLRDLLLRSQVVILFPGAALKWVMQGMAFGCVVICPTPRPSIHEIVTGESALLFDPTNLRGAVRQLDWLARNGELAAQIGWQGRGAMIGRTEIGVAKKLNEIYRLAGAGTIGERGVVVARRPASAELFEARSARQGASSDELSDRSPVPHKDLKTKEEPARTPYIPNRNTSCFSGDFH